MVHAFGVKSKLFTLTWILKIFSNFVLNKSFMVLCFAFGASHVAFVIKNLPASAGGRRDMGSIPGSGRSSGGRNGTSLQYSCLGKFHGQRSLVGYSPWGCKESDTTERLNTFMSVNHFE